MVAYRENSPLNAAAPESDCLLSRVEPDDVPKPVQMNLENLRAHYEVGLLLDSTPEQPSHRWLPA
jgi:hypothetical protein